MKLTITKASNGFIVKVEAPLNKDFNSTAVFENMDSMIKHVQEICEKMS